MTKLKCDPTTCYLEGPMCPYENVTMCYCETPKKFNPCTGMCDLECPSQVKLDACLQEAEAKNPPLYPPCANGIS